MKYLIILIAICNHFNGKAQNLSSEEFFTYIRFFPAIKYIENHTFEKIDTEKFRFNLITIVNGYLGKAGLDQNDKKKKNIDLVVYPINSDQDDFNEKGNREFEVLNAPYYSLEFNFNKKSS